jgi:predicted transcriptional regulator
MALTVRTDKELEDALTALVALTGRSRQEIIRSAVLEKLERSDHHSRVENATSEMLNRWADVIERLGNA